MKTEDTEALRSPETSGMHTGSLCNRHITNCYMMMRTTESQLDQAR